MNPTTAASVLQPQASRTWSSEALSRPMTVTSRGTDARITTATKVSTLPKWGSNTPVAATAIPDSTKPTTAVHRPPIPALSPTPTTVPKMGAID